MDEQEGPAPYTHAPLVPFMAATPPSGRIRVAIIGSTGSVGRQAVEVCLAHPEIFEVVALAAGRNIEVLSSQVRDCRPRVVGVTGGGDAASASDAASVDLARALRERVGDRSPSDVLAGPHALEVVATLEGVDVVLVATSGRAALPATLAALGAGRDVALANKESLVVAGPLVVDAVQRYGGRVFPVDSEHCALWQCVLGERPESVRRLVLTASGGPFRTWSADDIAEVTVAQALRHPTWQMGPKITIDSATLMNKGLEAIEAHWMFGVPYDRIDIAIHPPSIVHSLVEFVDGSSKAQLGWPDMRLPIQLAMTRGARLVRRRDAKDPASRPFSVVDVGSLGFEAVDLGRFPCLRLALDAGRAGGTTPAVLSAADEVVVEAFLGGGLRFGHIAEVVEGTLRRVACAPVESLAHLLAVDEEARAVASELVAARR